MVLDSHTHAWGYPSRQHPWVNGPLIDVVDSFAVGLVYDADTLREDMEAVGVDEAVVVGYPICEWTDNWYTVRCVERHDPLYGVVMVDLFADDAPTKLQDLMTVEDVIGVRLGAACPYDGMWERFDETATWLRDAIDRADFWEAAIDTDALVQILAHEAQLDQALELVETYPELTYVFDHYGQTDPAVPPEESDFATFGALADHDGVAVKLSETPHWSNESFPYEDMHEHVRWLLDRFGRERLIWGSDFPNVSDVATYEESYRWLDHVDGLSSTDRTWITGRSFDEHVGL